MNEDKIFKKLVEHDERFDKADVRFEKIDYRFDKIDERLEKVINKLIEHDEKFDNMVTKDEFYQFKDEILTGQDKMMTILQRLDEERVFTNKWIGEIEEQVEESKNEINKIKLRLKVA